LVSTLQIKLPSMQNVIIIDHKHLSLTHFLRITYKTTLAVVWWYHNHLFFPPFFYYNQQMQNGYHKIFITTVFPCIFKHRWDIYCAPGSIIGTVTGYGLDDPGIKSWWGGKIFRTCPDRPWGPPSSLYNGYRVFPGGKERPGHDTDHSPPSSAVVMKE